MWDRKDTRHALSLNSLNSVWLFYAFKWSLFQFANAPLASQLLTNPEPLDFISHSLHFTIADSTETRSLIDAMSLKRRRTTCRPERVRATGSTCLSATNSGRVRAFACVHQLASRFSFFQVQGERVRRKIPERTRSRRGAGAKTFERTRAAPHRSQPKQKSYLCHWHTRTRASTRARLVCMRNVCVCMARVCSKNVRPSVKLESSERPTPNRTYANVLAHKLQTSGC